MNILAISCGSPNGNCEILLKAALNAAISSLPGTTGSILNLSNLSFPSYPIPGTFDPSTGSANAIPQGLPIKDQVPDDRPAALDAILNADALILASPVYTRQPAGILKYFCDKTLGPFVDASFVRQVLEGQKNGDPRFAKFAPDKRVLKPRVAALIAVGGATSTEWGSFALPLMHQCVFSLHAKVVDQLHVDGRPFPGSVLLLEEEDVMQRAELLGRNVASQMGKVFEEAKFLGDREGSCPHCHLDMIVLNGTGDNGIDCAVCGAKGKLVVDDKGIVGVTMFAEPVTSVITMEGKARHMREIGIVGKKLGPKMPGVKEEIQRYKDMDEGLVLRMPSQDKE
ncbi:hypothetical protein VE03_06889 [Pseudogymnoascus sp. 23342-1-I1]|nr:hypothetical protein VE03_06889 [Pseudogymnoascus sp. 23342-1-I1]